ncbi:MAG: hypothetical protein IJA59_07845, partial [Clostridia bacterium]|nr:hypothetical protein [Clostridia bacterium]
MMSTMWKRAISMLLVCTMLLPMTPVTVFAEGTEEHDHDHDHTDEGVIVVEEPTATETVTDPTEAPADPTEA